MTVEVENPAAGGNPGVPADFIEHIYLGDHPAGYRISHHDLVRNGLRIRTSGTPRK